MHNNFMWLLLHVLGHLLINWDIDLLFKMQMFAANFFIHSLMKIFSFQNDLCFKNVTEK